MNKTSFGCFTLFHFLCMVLNVVQVVQIVLFVLCFMSLLNCYRIGLSCSRLLKVNFKC